MNNDTLKTLLSAYAAPTPDDGFSDQFMLTLETESNPETVDIREFQAPTRSRWRSWVVTLILGFMAGLLWVRLGISLPDIPAMPESPDLPGLSEMDWALYVGLGLCLAAGLIFLETEAY